MILVDTSVAIDYARGKDAKLVALMHTLPVVVCGIVRAELLCGARDPKHRSDLLALLAAFNQLAISVARPIPRPTLVSKESSTT
jgi:predicted nucleic acid-binding protein